MLFRSREERQERTERREERNELLTALLHRAQLDGSTSRKLISQSQAQQEALQAQYSTYTRTLQETERTLARLNVVRFPDAPTPPSHVSVSQLPWALHVS